MAVRDIIRIDEATCDGCGECVTACAEGAIALVDGKARLVSDSYCDGLGTCLGHCPTGAITVECVEAAPFDPAAVAARLRRTHPRPGRPPVPLPAGLGVAAPHAAACPGSLPAELPARAADGPLPGDVASSALSHWPVQLHLVSPRSPWFLGADLLLAADCVAHAASDFHARLLAGRRLAIACPKLDGHQDLYVEKLVALIDVGGVRSILVAVMEVPCCGGLARLAAAAAARAARPVPVRTITVGIDGRILGERDLLTPPAA